MLFEITEINNIIVHETELYLHENGFIKEFILDKNRKIYSIPCLANTKIIFFENGLINECVISEDFEISNKKYPSGQKLVFNMNGKISNK